MTLGEKVHALRRRNGWTQRDVGSAIAVSPNYVARIERGEIRQPSGELIKRLAMVFGCTTDYLLGMGEKESALP